MPPADMKEAPVPHDAHGPQDAVLAVLRGSLVTKAAVGPARRPLSSPTSWNGAGPPAGLCSTPALRT